MGQKGAFQEFSSPNMRIDVKNIDGVFVVKCIDKLDIYNSSHFDAIIDNLVTEHENSVFLNLDEVFYIDSSGLGALISSMRKLKSHGRFFKLIGLNDFVKKVFSRAHMSTYFDIYETEEEALKSLQG